MDPSYPLDSNPGSRTARSKKSRHNHTHPLSIPNDTTWGSDEAIVLAENGQVVQKTGESVGVERGQNGVHATVKVGRRGAGTAGHAHEGQITVVQEYSVQETNEPSVTGERPRNHTPFGFLHK